MKIVIKLTKLAENHGCAVRFGRAVAGLFQDSHSVIIVHGHTGSAQAGVVAAVETPVAIAQVQNDNRSLVAILNRTGTSALGISGADGGMCEIRKSHRALGRMEVASMNPRWVDVICGNRGVPVISNVVLGSGAQHCLFDADEMAAACAGAWRADALIYLTSVDGVRDLDGSTIRWLDISNLDGLENKATVTQDMLGKLKACRQAIASGVGRVRILPVSHVDSLPLFFFSRIDFGTEVIASRGCSQCPSNGKTPAWFSQ